MVVYDGSRGRTGSKVQVQTLRPAIRAKLHAPASAPSDVVIRCNGKESLGAVIALNVRWSSLTVLS